MVTTTHTARNHLSPLNTSWHNRSMSSISATSDASTFHSAHAHPSNMELRPMSQPAKLPQQHSMSPTKPMASPKLESIKMERQDSGYSDSSQSPVSSSRRTSVASSTPRPQSPSKHKRRSTHGSTNSTSRQSTKRNSRSSAQIRTSTSSARPNIQQRHTTPHAQSPHTQQYQFFQFPTLSDPVPDPDVVAAPPPPPATVQYWTSDSTRRLEYAAIDAATKGVRGFFIKLVPDCILPASSRRTKFHCDDAASDAGSVRRYRLALPAEEKDTCSATTSDSAAPGRRSAGLLRRWTSFGRRG